MTSCRTQESKKTRRSINCMLLGYIRSLYPPLAVESISLVVLMRMHKNIVI